MTTAPSSSDWDAVLPVLEDDKAVVRVAGLLGFTTDVLAHELRLKRAAPGVALKDEEDEIIENALREAVVLLLRDGATYKPVKNSAANDHHDGRLVYLLPGPNVRGRIERALAGRSRAEFIRQTWWNRVVPAVVYAFKVFIGLFLIVSLVLLALAFIALLAAAAAKSRDSASGRFGGGGSSFFWSGGRRHRGFWHPFRFWLWPCPIQAGGGGAAAAATGRAALAEDADEGMSFAEAVFSFIFGDSGAQTSREEAQVSALKSFIHHSDGRRLKAVQFTPFLIDPPPLPEGQSASGDHSPLKDERFMARIVWLFKGRPVASDDGKLSYEFPRPSAASTKAMAFLPRVDMFREKKLMFSLASPSQQKLALGLGIANLVTLVLVWSRPRRSDAELLQWQINHGGFLAGGALRMVTWMFPVLVAYAVLFLTIPAARLWYIRRRNKQIDAENDAREMWRRRQESLMV